MKARIFIIQISILFPIMLSCQDATPKPAEEAQKSSMEINAMANKTVSKPMKKMPVKSNSRFSGKFSAIHNTKEISMTLIPQADSEKVAGTLIMDGKTAQLSLSEKSTICNGKITEDATGKHYAIVLKFVGKKLNCAITFPEFGNKVLSFDLFRSTLADGSNNHNRNPDVTGKWRFTEVLSSGSGQFYASFSTDYFVKIKADGTALTWTGKSAGGTNAVAIEGGYGTNVQHYQWYTAGTTFHFVNPQDNKEEVVNYYAEPSRMMFSYGNNKRVYQRVD